MSLISIESGKSKLIVEPNSGQVVQWDYDGVGVFYQGSTIRRSGIPILFPFANPLKDHILEASGKKIGQHGFGRDFPWQIGEKTGSSIEMILIPRDISPEMHQAYPFDFEAKIKLEFIENIFIYTLQISNHGNKPMPIAPGVHPYFPVEHNLKSTLVINNLQGYNLSHIDWDKESNGYFYNFNESTEIVFPNGQILQMNQAGQKDFQHLVIWSQTSANLDHDFICIEPFTRGTNAINDNPIMISPKEKWTSCIVFTCII